MRLSGHHLIFIAVLLAGCEPFVETTLPQPATETPPPLIVSSSTTQTPMASTSLAVTGTAPSSPRQSPSAAPFPDMGLSPTTNGVQPKHTSIPTLQDGSPGIPPAAPTTRPDGNCVITLMMDFDGLLTSEATGSPATVHIPAQTSLRAFYVVQQYEIQRPAISVEYDGYHGLISYEYFYGSSCTPPLQVTIERAPPYALTATPSLSPSQARVENWTLTSAYISSDQCAGAATLDVTVPITLEFDASGRLIILNWYARTWKTGSTDNTTYSGVAVVESSGVEEMIDTIILVFTSPQSFEGDMIRTVTSSNLVCKANYKWHGTRP